MKDRSKDKAPAQKDRAVLAFIDAIEEGVARMVQKGAGGAIIDYRLPAAMLPKGAQEGSWIELRLRVVPPPAGEDATALRRRLVQGDDGGDMNL